MHLYVHIGQPKSGSTALQRAFAQHSDDATAPLVYYPKVGRLDGNLVGHHNLAYELYNPHKFSKLRGAWSDLAQELADCGSDKVLLSTEAFRNFLAPILRAKFRKLFPSTRRSTVLYLRPQWEYAESGYNQLLRFGKTELPFEEFWHTSGKKICNYRKTIETWEKRDDHEEFLCLPFDKKVREKGIVQDFAQNVLQVHGELDNASRVNPRMGLLSISAVHYCRFRMRQLQDDPHAHLPASFVMKLSNTFRDHPDEIMDYTFVSPQLRDEIFTESVEVNQWIAQNHSGFRTDCFLARPVPSDSHLVKTVPDLAPHHRELCEQLLQKALAKGTRNRSTSTSKAAPDKHFLVDTTGKWTKLKRAIGLKRP